MFDSNTDLSNYVDLISGIDSQFLNSNTIHLPQNMISQLFFICVCILGLYILFKLQQKN
jgi:hypothetical protein